MNKYGVKDEYPYKTYEDVHSMIKYGMTMRWTDISGEEHAVGIRNCETLKEAREACKKWAQECGWKPKKWWQWWRWKDTKYYEI